MIVMYVIPVLLFIYIPQIIPLVLMFGLAIPAWLSAKMYNRFFQKLEDQIMENNKPADGEAAEEDEHIFSDEQIIQ